MSWNYRICRERTDDDEWYSIREVHYDDAGVIRGWTERPTGVSGYTLDEILADLDHHAVALTKPVIDVTDESNPVELQP